MANKPMVQDWKRPVEWALGNFDQACFTLGSRALELRRRHTYTAEPEGMSWLEQLADTPLDLKELFAKPNLPHVRLTPTKLPLVAQSFNLPYRVSKLTFPSAIATPYPVDNTVHAFYLQHQGHENGPTMLYLHGWMEFEPGVSLRLPIAWSVGLGLNILALHMPFHFERTVAGTISGELSLTGNLPMTVKTLQQAVSDVRQAFYWLKAQRPNAPVILVGKSLGGMLGAMTLVNEGDFAAAVLAVPAISTKASIWQSEYTRPMRKELMRQGLDEEATSRLLEVIRPSRYQPLLDPKRILILKAQADRVCFPQDTDQFVQDWHTPMFELPTGHLTATMDPRGRKAVQAHLRRYLDLPSA